MAGAGAAVGVAAGAGVTPAAGAWGVAGGGGSLGPQARKRQARAGASSPGAMPVQGMEVRSVMAFTSADWDGGAPILVPAKGIRITNPRAQKTLRATARPAMRRRSPQGSRPKLAFTTPFVKKVFLE